MNEIKIRKKGADTTKISLEHFPLDMDVIDSAGGTILVFDMRLPFKTFDGNLTPKEYKKYLKEISALLEDFDDIFNEINKKYKLKEEK